MLIAGRFLTGMFRSRVFGCKHQNGMWFWKDSRGLLRKAWVGGAGTRTVGADH